MKNRFLQTNLVNSSYGKEEEKKYLLELQINVRINMTGKVYQDSRNK